MGLIRTYLVALAFLLLAASPPAMARTSDPLSTAARALCHRRVALLGENGEHGSGATLAFKAALVERLITRCGYRAILFEANRYQFISFGRAVTAGSADVAGLRAAVGDLWGRYAEFAPLADFLTTEARAGRVRLAGLDDALGVRHATFANAGMIGELTGSLPPARAADCAERLRARVAWDQRPASYPPGARAALLACIAQMRVGAQRGTERDALTAALDRLTRRDLEPMVAQFAGREQSMFKAFMEVAATLPRDKKIIVWGATAHLARDASTWPALPDAPSLGALIHRRYGAGAFTLGFAALEGSWRRSPAAPAITWSPAPVDALERRALGAVREVAYLDRRALRKAGAIPARIWNEPFVTTRWDAVIDGLVAFRGDRPPTLLR